MVKFLRPGKVVIILNGRFAGHKAVIVKNFDDGNAGRSYGHALVVGIERYPLKVTKSMPEKLIAKRSRVKPFIKLVNYNHMMPTRYSVDLDFKETFNNANELVKDPQQKRVAKRNVKKLLQERYVSGKNRWFFQKLRF